MPSPIPTRCKVLSKGILLGIVWLPPLGAAGTRTETYVAPAPAMATKTMTYVCTSLSDATPAAGTTFAVQSGECAGNINLAAGNDGVTIDFLSGAEPFQAGKSIVLPTTGVIVNLKVRFTGVNWGAVSQKLFSGGSATNLELNGLVVEFTDSTINSTVSNPIGLLGMLTTGSQYTVSTTTLSVVGLPTGGHGVELAGGISGGSAVTIHSSNISVAGGSSACSGLKLIGAFTDSRLTISGGSQLMATSSNGYAYGISFDFTAPFIDSTLVMKHASAVQATSNYQAYAIRFSAAMTNSTLTMADRSVVEATSNKNAYGIHVFAPITNSTLCMTSASVVTSTSNGVSTTAYGIGVGGAFTSSTLCMTHGSVVEGRSMSGSGAYGIYFWGAFTTDSTLCMTHASQSTATAPSGTARPIHPSSITSVCQPTATATVSLPSETMIPPPTRTVSLPMTTAPATTPASSGSAATVAAATTAMVESTAAATAAASGSTIFSSSPTGNGASSVTAVALGLMTMVLAMF